MDLKLACEMLKTWTLKKRLFFDNPNLKYNA